MRRIGVVEFPGSLDADVVARAVRLAGASPVPLTPADHDLAGVEAVILPDAVTDVFEADEPLLAALAERAEQGLPVLGIGRGFAALCAAGLLPGRLSGNDPAGLVCRDQAVRVESRDTVWTCALTEGDRATLVVRGAAGRYVADDATLQALEDGDQVVLRYVDGNPNGSAHDIAALTNASGTVVGTVPLPEHSTDALTGPSEDGRLVFASVVAFLTAAD